MKYRNDIDGLRAVSVLAVVAFHAGLSRFAGGYVGVDVFFAISGFLITSLLIREVQTTGRVALGEFAGRRIRRLLPMAAFTITTTMLAGAWIVPAVARPGIIADARSAAFYVSNWRFAGLATAYSDTNVTDGLFIHFWSLSVEEQFYVLWPLAIVGVLWAGRRLHWNRPLLSMGLVIAALTSASLAASVILAQTTGPASYYFTHTRIWEMGSGALLAFAILRRERWGGRWLEPVGWIGLGCIAAAVLLYGPRTPFPSYTALLPVGGALAVLAASGREGSLLGRVLSLRPLPLIGRLSYGWYLLHWPAIGLILIVNSRVPSPVAPEIATGFAVVASLAAAAVTYHTIENPIRRSVGLRAITRALPVGAALSIAPVLVGLGLLATINTGDTPVTVAGLRTTSSTPPIETSVPATGTSILDAPTPATPSDSFDILSVVVPIDSPMTPGQAQEDWSDELNVCRTPDAMKTGSDRCMFGDPMGAVTLVVLGDSHADHWFPPLRIIAEANSWRLIAFSKSQCSVADVRLYSTRFEREFTECADWRSEVLSHLQSVGPIDLVLIGRSFNYPPITINPDGSLVSAEDFGAVWQSGAGRSFQQLAGLADGVVQILDTPWSPVDVPTCISEHIDGPAACNFLRDGQSGLDSEMAKAEAEALDSLMFIDPTDQFCDQTSCFVVTGDGIIVFKDRHHMTETFSATLAPWLEGEIKQILATLAP